MRARTATWMVCALAAVNLCGCGLVDFRLFPVTKEEALARQVMGVLRALNADVVLFESVRGMDEDGEVKEPPKVSPSAATVISAMQRREFNRDDVQFFLRQGMARERNNGLLDYYCTSLCQADPPYARFVQAIVAEENADRMVIMKRVTEVGEGLSGKSLPKVQRIFAQRNRDTAEAGVWIQQPNKKGSDGAVIPDSGDWTQKKKGASVSNGLGTAWAPTRVRSQPAS